MPRLLKPENYVVIQGWMITELDLKGNELLIYACVYGFSQKENQAFNGSLQYLSEWTNLSKRNVIERLKALIEKGLIIKNERMQNNVKSCEYRALCVPGDNGGSDETSPPMMNHHRCRIITGGDETSPNNKDIYNISNINNNTLNSKNIENIESIESIKNTKKKRVKKSKEEHEIYDSVIDYLNQKTGKKFRATTPATRTLISARLAEGHNLSDFQRVIDNKAAAWKNDAKMQNYLRPETLFAPSHFESYLNETPTVSTDHGFEERNVTESDFDNLFVDVMNRPRRTGV